MKPNPFASLNHLTVPVILFPCSLCLCCGRGSGRTVSPTQRTRDLCPHDGLASNALVQTIRGTRECRPLFIGTCHANATIRRSHILIGLWRTRKTVAPIELRDPGSALPPVPPPRTPPASPGSP